jgi:hypothetical protein
MRRACRIHGEKKNAYRALVGKPEGKIPLKRPRGRLKDNIKMNLRNIRWYGRDCWLRIGTSGVSYGPCNVPSSSIKFSDVLE